MFYCRISRCLLQVFFLAILLNASGYAQQPASPSAKPSTQDCLNCHTDFDTKQFNNSVHQSLDCTDCHTDIKSLPHADTLKDVDCTICHNDEKDGKTYLKSVHGLSRQKNANSKAAYCSDCHGTHDILDAHNKLSKVFWSNIPQTCGQCHKQEYKEYSMGIHGQALAAGSRDTPVCTDCHGEHDINAVKRASSRVSSANIPQTCGQCHAAQRINAEYSLPGNVLGSYMQSYHGLGLQQGALTAANCSSCHGVHEILPSSDPRSTINPKNLEKTCGQCHPGIGSQVSHGSIHGRFVVGINPLNDWVRHFYIFLIFFVSGLLLLHNLLDFSKKARAHYERTRQQGVECMGKNERYQHFVLIACFFILAYTGFALKFPQTWWSFMFFGHNGWLHWGHRITGIIFAILVLYHMYYLFFTRKGRFHLKALSFKKDDLVQCWQSFEYYLGYRKKKPELAMYSYMQKLEYWALLWGSLIMVITGGLMFSEVWFLSHMPNWLYDVVRAVHFYEAILACVTIIIWHGYFVIFDPDVYPGNQAWLHGRSSHK